MILKLINTKHSYQDLDLSVLDLAPGDEFSLDDLPGRAV